MKVAVMSVLAVLVGTAVGVMTTGSKFEGSVFGGLFVGDEKTGAYVRPEPPPADGPQPKCVVDEPTYDFGRMERGETGEHDFVIRNEGQYPLHIKLGGTSCSCTVTRLGGKGVDQGANMAVVGPSESLAVTVSWTAKAEGGFRQRATIYTNDANSQSVDLRVTGEVFQTIDVRPSRLAMGDIDVVEGGSSELDVLSFAEKPLEIAKLEFTNPRTAEHFQTTIMELAKEDLGDPKAESGYRIRVTAKPGMPIGMLRQSLLIHTSEEDRAPLDVPIDAMVSGPVLIRGKGMDIHRRVLELGGIVSSEGLSRKLLMSVRGAKADALEVSLAAAEPEFVKVTFGEKRQIDHGDQSVVIVEMTVEIPPGSPAANHLGSELGPLGVVEIQTNLKDARRVRLPIRFAVQR